MLWDHYIFVKWPAGDAMWCYGFTSTLVRVIVCHLTHWGRDKMAAFSQTTLSNAFSWIKMFEFRLRFHWILFPGIQLTIFQHWFRLWLGAGQATSHYLNQWWFVYWRIYASLGLNELTEPSYCPNQCWLIINMIRWHSPGDNSTGNVPEFNQ